MIYALGRTGMYRFIIPDVVGLYCFMGLGFSLGVYAGVRNLFFSPEVFIRKDTRGAGYPEDPAVINAALHWKKSIFRSYANMYNRSPSALNDRFSKVEDVRDPPEAIMQKYKAEKEKLQASYM
eukprot:TRINITY_DN16977_c0_g1_i1.p4 TRINITY_DN16977_c0_g1~~TRINITY_DN16977_c0_g1_i1.p4  ORF type:complete len:123 (-),score=8.92 TRINITY_DN16977_c0_g1_i1:430-798(-)